MSTFVHFLLMVNYDNPSNAFSKDDGARHNFIFMNKMYHVFSEGENVLFREDADYIFFNNKFASSSYTFRLRPLGETTMSTHFHSLLETADQSAIDDFILKIRKSYALYYSTKYGHSLGNAFKISKIEIFGLESIKNEVLYILKNPVHHYMCSFPMEYPYSSVSYIFMDKLLSPTFRESLMLRTTRFGELSGRKKIKIVGTDTVPDDWMVFDNGMILPSSYINISKVRALWNGSIKSFIYDINKNQTDARKEIITADILDLRTSTMPDTEVCAIIDQFSKSAGYKSFHDLNDKEISTIIRILKQKGIPDSQTSRCLWIR